LLPLLALWLTGCPGDDSPSGATDSLGETTTSDGIIDSTAVEFTTTSYDTTAASDPCFGFGCTSTGEDTTEGTTGGLPPFGRPDLDGDGVIDYVFSARGHDMFSGAVWIDYDADAITGGPRGADVRLDGGTNLGLSLTLCDLDGDGIDDLAAASLAGIHVYWGGARLVDGAVEDLLITAADQLSVVGGLGCADVTGDGIPDVVGLGSSFSSWSLTVVEGRPDLRSMVTLDADADPTAVHIDSSDGSLLPALGIGDVNADDVADVVVGATFGGDLGNGATFVFMGGGGLASGTSADADVLLEGGMTSTGFGTSLAVGDLDADGIDDLAIAEAGRVSILQGGPGISMPPTQTLEFPGLVTPPTVTSTFRIGSLNLLDVLGIETTDGGDQVFLAVLDPLADMILVCSVALDGMDQTAPRPLPTQYAELLGPPRRGALSVPVLRHGRTNPMTFMPDGDGRMQSFSWLRPACQPIAGATAQIAGIDQTGVIQELWSDPAGWSALPPRLR
jgi:hypothetical protein